MKKFILYIIPALLFMACTEPEVVSNTDNIFDVKAYFEQEIIRLSNAKVAIVQVVNIDGEEERIEPDSINWENQLASFLVNDINKPAYNKEIKEVVIEDTLVIMKYMFNAKRLPLKTLEITFESADANTPLFMDFTLEESNLLYNMKRSLHYNPTIGYKITEKTSIIGLINNEIKLEGSYINE